MVTLEALAVETQCSLGEIATQPREEDSVLSMETTDYIFKDFPDIPLTLVKVSRKKMTRAQTSSIR